MHSGSGLLRRVPCYIAAGQLFCSFCAALLAAAPAAANGPPAPLAPQASFIMRPPVWACLAALLLGEGPNRSAAATDPFAAALPPLPLTLRCPRLLPHQCAMAPAARSSPGVPPQAPGEHTHVVWCSCSGDTWGGRYPALFPLALQAPTRRATVPPVPTRSHREPWIQLDLLAANSLHCTDYYATADASFRAGFTYVRARGLTPRGVT